MSQSTPLIDIPGAAEKLGITERHVRRMVHERRHPYIKVGKFVRFDPAAIEQWIEANRVPVGR